MSWETMTKQERETIETLINSQNTFAAKKRMAKALGVEFEGPDVPSQIKLRGKIVQDYKRGRSIHGRTMALIPPVTLSTGRVVPELAVEPQCVRAIAMELLRLADSMGW